MYPFSILRIEEFVKLDLNKIINLIEVTEILIVFGEMSNIEHKKMLTELRKSDVGIKRTDTQLGRLYLFYKSLDKITDEYLSTIIYHYFENQKFHAPNQARKIPKFYSTDTYSFYPNPYYDEVFVFLGKIPAFKHRYVPSKEYPDLYKMDIKQSVQKFIKETKSKLLKSRKDWWPYTSHLIITFGLSGNKSYVSNSDIDNLLKTVFDSFKGIVFEDDSQITSVMTEKSLMPETSGFIVGLRQIQNFEKNELIPHLYCGGEDIWKYEREEKMKYNRFSIIEFYE